MAGLKEIRDAAVKAAEEFSAGNFVAGGRQVVVIINAGLDTAEDLGFKAGPDDQKCCDEAKVALETCAKIVSEKRGDAVGKLGDGVLLKLLIELAIKFLPLFLGPKP